MTAWTFVAAAYGVTIGGTAGLLGWAWVSMRAAERQVDALKRRP
jgi:Heme exporter protein D (CcmD)